MKKRILIAGGLGCIVAALAGIAVAAGFRKSEGERIVLEAEFQEGSQVEYTGGELQFPLAHVENERGEIISYDVDYAVVDSNTQETLESEYAAFPLKVGEYRFVCTYIGGEKLTREIPFRVEDTKAPKIEFLDVPNGLFLQDLKQDEILKLPSYTVADASEEAGLEMKKTLYFKGAEEEEFQEYSYREINNSYTPQSCGKFKYELTVTDAYQNSTTQSVEWRIKDRDWKPTDPLTDGYLADYASEGYINYVEAGDANQWYQIGNDYEDTWLEEYEGAKGVMKIEMGFNDAAGWGNNAIKLHFARSFTQEDIRGKYLAVRMRVEGKNLNDSLLFGGNNVEFREADQTTRAFTSPIEGMETDKWVTYYIAADTAEHIGMYPQASYNPETTFYEGGGPSACLQLCFSRMAGYYNKMTLYLDSITLAEKLPETEIAVDGKEADWEVIEGAEGYRVTVNEKETVQKENRISLVGEKGCIRILPLGDGALTLDGEETVAVFGLDAGEKLAAFDDELYLQLFSDRLRFSTEAEHTGYRPKTMNGIFTGDGVTLELGTGYWGVCSGTRILFPQAKEKGGNTTLVLNMSISNDDYRLMRVFDYDGKPMGEFTLTPENTGKLYRFEIDLSQYEGKLKGLNLIFGPSGGMVEVPGGVILQFRDMEYDYTYYNITVNGETLTCVGERDLEAGYTTEELVQFMNFFNFGVPEDNTLLSFEGTVLLDGKKLGKSAFSVIGYPNTDTICLNVAHSGRILTVMKDSIIYYGGKAVIVGNTFNAKWQNNQWVPIARIPDPPAAEYIRVGDQELLVENRTTLKAGYTTGGLVQFKNVCDFGVPEDNTPLSFEGIVMLDGQKVNSVNWVGYPDNATVCLNIPHKGRLLTILKDAVIYYGGKAVIVTETFNARWENNQWVPVSQIPDLPEDEYISVGGQQRLVVNKMPLTPGYTTGALVQFTDVADFGVSEDNTPLFFEGTVLLDGKRMDKIRMTGYPENTTICLNLPHNGRILTVLKDAVIYYGGKAAVVTETFNAKWENGGWVAVEQIPSPPQKEYVTVQGQKKEVVNKTVLTPGYTTEALVQFTDVYDFGVPEENTALGLEGTVLLNGVPVNNVNLVGYKENATICLNLPHNGKVLTIKKDAIIHYGDKAVVVTENFNARWENGSWTAVEQIPNPPQKEYVTVQDQKKEVVNKTALTAGYTTGVLVQFTDVYDFGAAADNTPLGLEGTVLLDGVPVSDVNLVGYKGNTTICLNIPHNGRVLTIKKDAIIHYGDKAVIVTETFNAKWENGNWNKVDEIPQPSEKEYVTVEGQKKEVVGRIALTAGFTTGTLVQFTDVYDFGAAADNTPLSLEGTVLLDGAPVSDVNLVGYKGNTTICLNIPHNGRVLTILKDAIIYYGDKAVIVTENFNAKWENGNWSKVDEIPQQDAISFTYSYGNDKLIQVKTNLPAATPCVNFLATDHGSNIDQSDNQYQQFSWAGMATDDAGNIYIAFNFNSSFTAGQTYVLPQGAVFGFSDGKSYKLDRNYIFTFDGNDWAMTTEEGTKMAKLSVLCGDIVRGIPIKAWWHSFEQYACLATTDSMYYGKK